MDSDINPESGFRLPLPDRASMNEEEKRIYDKMTDASLYTLAGMKGPKGISLHNPKLAEKEHALNQYLRYESGINGRTRELAVLVSAREMDSRFEWAAHEAVAIKEGLEKEIIDIIKYRKNIAGLKECDAVIIQLGREAFCNHKVSSETFARALKVLGFRSLVNLVSLMGDYAATAIKLCVFDNQIKPDQPVLPIP